MRPTVRFATLVSLMLILGLATNASLAGPASDGVIVIGHTLDPAHLNPSQTTAAAWETVVAGTTEKLIVQDAKDPKRLNPLLATSWKWVDKTTLEMDLRQGVRFTNGEPFDAEAAKFTIDTFAQAPRYRVVLPEGVYDRTEIVGSHKIRVYLKQPYQPFLSFIARGGYVLPPRYYAQVGPSKFGQEPIGTGPFMLTKWVKDNYIELSRNPNYWGGPVRASKVVFRVIPEDTARVAALEAGEIHLAMEVPLTAVDRLRRAQNIDVIYAPGLRKFSVYFDTKFGVGSPKALRDPRVRLALNLAVDKVTIKERLFKGFVEILEGQYVTKEEEGYTPKIKMYPYDPNRARELLSQAGFPDGFELQFTYSVGRYAMDKELGELIASYWQAVGIKVRQRPLEFGTWVKLFDEKLIGTHMVGALQPIEPYANFQKYLADRFEFHVLRKRGEIRLLLRRAAVEYDASKREAIYHRISQIVYEDPPMLFLHTPMNIYGVSKSLTGFTPRLDELVWLHGLEIR